MGSEKIAQQKEVDTQSVQQKKSKNTAVNMMDNRPEAAAQRKMQAIMQGVSQTVQRAPEEEEMAQGKFEIQRAPEEEEMAQG